MLAIVIPYYKYDYFEATLQSLAAQTNKQFHVYIGDDASPKPPTDLLLKFQGQFSFSYHRFESNLGGTSLVKQWNRCLDLVQNKTWLQILGDDDVLAPNVVASFYENLPEITEVNSAVVRFATQVIDEKGTTISSVFTHPQKEFGFDFLERKINGATRSSLSEYIFLKTQLNQIGVKDFSLAWYSDLCLVVELGLEKPIFSINTSSVFFRNSGLNITSKKDNLLLKNEATFAFNFYLIRNYRNKISPSLLKVLYFKLEKTILDNKKNIGFWIKTLLLYTTNGRFLQFISLIFKAIKSIL